MKTECDRCKCIQPNVGLWKTPPWKGTMLCGRCKVELTMTPDRVKSLEQDIKLAVLTLDAQFSSKEPNP